MPESVTTRKKIKKVKVPKEEKIFMPEWDGIREISQ